MLYFLRSWNSGFHTGVYWRIPGSDHPVKKLIIISFIIGAAIILYFLNPEHTLWMPKCYFFLITGWQCPACGSQRALHQLLHLNFASAFAYNPFLLISFPYLLALVFLQWFDERNRFQKLRAFCHGTLTIRIYLVLIVLWWILRNIISL